MIPSIRAAHFNSLLTIDFWKDSAFCCRVFFLKGDDTMAEIALTPLTEDDREQFILDNQRAFQFGALEEFGRRDGHFEEDGEIISRKTIEAAIDGGKAYRIREDGTVVGGLILRIDEAKQHNHLELLFIAPEAHGRGLGFAAWQAVERLYPETRVWETCTPYFETRNIHFYINKCGFHAVEFFHARHPDPHAPETGGENDYADASGADGMFRFEKQMPAADEAYDPDREIQRRHGLLLLQKVREANEAPV